MMLNWGLATGATWAGAALLVAGVVILVGAITLLVRWLRGARSDEFGAELIGHEMLDECFAKSEMSREDCEGRCKGFGHPCEKPHLPPSAPADLAP
jgi:Zn-dependent protease with chaperone function